MGSWIIPIFRLWSYWSGKFEPRAGFRPLSSRYLWCAWECILASISHTANNEEQSKFDLRRNKSETGFLYFSEHSWGVDRICGRVVWFDKLCWSPRMKMKSLSQTAATTNSQPSFNHYSNNKVVHFRQALDHSEHPRKAKGGPHCGVLWKLSEDMQPKTTGQEHRNGHVILVFGMNKSLFRKQDEEFHSPRVSTLDRYFPYLIIDTSL